MITVFLLNVWGNNQLPVQNPSMTNMDNPFFQIDLNPPRASQVNRAWVRTRQSSDSDGFRQEVVAAKPSYREAYYLAKEQNALIKANNPNLKFNVGIKDFRGQDYQSSLENLASDREKFVRESAGRNLKFSNVVESNPAYSKQFAEERGFFSDSYNATPANKKANLIRNVDGKFKAGDPNAQISAFSFKNKEVTKTFSSPIVQAQVNNVSQNPPNLTNSKPYAPIVPPILGIPNASITPNLRSSYFNQDNPFFSTEYDSARYANVNQDWVSQRTVRNPSSFDQRNLVDPVAPFTPAKSPVATSTMQNLKTGLFGIAKNLAKLRI